MIAVKGMEMPERCAKCKFCTDKKTNDYGTFGECLLQGYKKVDGLAWSRDADCPLVSTILIPEGATNGDMIKAMFPNGKEYDNDGDVRYEIEIDFDYSFCSYFDGAWWNAPYKEGAE